MNSNAPNAMNARLEEPSGPPNAVIYAAPLGAFFCPEISRVHGFWGQISSTISKVLSDCKVLFKHQKKPLMAANSR